MKERVFLEPPQWEGDHDALSSQGYQNYQVMINDYSTIYEEKMEDWTSNWINHFVWSSGTALSDFNLYMNDVYKGESDFNRYLKDLIGY